MKISKGGTLGKIVFLVFFSMHYFTLKVHRRLLECHFGVLECWKTQKKPISKNCNIFEKYPKGGPFEKKIFCFLFNSEFYYGISKETIRIPFGGLTMLKSPKLIIKGGLCYGFAMVPKYICLSDFWKKHQYHDYPPWYLSALHNAKIQKISHFYKQLFTESYLLLAFCW